MRVSDVTLRRELNMSASPFWGPFGAMDRAGVPLLYGFSPHVVPRPADWPPNHHVTGYWFLDPDDGWQPPADLAAFLAAGPPPVYIGFGSMANRDPAEAAQIMLDALAQSGQRGVIASGWGGLTPSDLPDRVHMLSSIPHSWLFPRMAAVVHHGGAGTTAAGLRAGVPSIIVPFFGDQPFWGRRVAELGVGPVPIPRRKLTASALADAITRAVTDPAMRARAAALGEQIRAEDGIAAAAAHIEAYRAGRISTPAPAVQR
jgi:sterol 3beta-glucosyltransferase